MLATPDDVAARGRRVILRRKRLPDGADDYAWRCDEELARFDAAPPLRTSFVNYLASMSAQQRYPDSGRRSFAIEDEGGRHIGNVMYYNLRREAGEAELGITIGDRTHWGQGYGSDAVQTLVRFLFYSKGLHRVFLHTLDWNTRAQRCFIKAGFEPRGTVWREGQNFILMEVRRSRRGGSSQRRRKE